MCWRGEVANYNTAQLALLVGVSLLVNLNFARAGPGECLLDWYGLNASCYRAFEGPADWLEARQNCINFDGVLTSIHSEAENAHAIFVCGNTRPFSQSCWIGGTDKKQRRNVWKWADGTPWDWSKWFDHGGGNAEPNNDFCSNHRHCTYGDTADCSSLEVSGKTPFRSYWLDTFCTEKRKYICRIDQAYAAVATAIPATTLPPAPAGPVSSDAEPSDALSSPTRTVTSATESGDTSQSASSPTLLSAEISAVESLGERPVVAPSPVSSGSQADNTSRRMPDAPVTGSTETIEVSAAVPVSVSSVNEPSDISRRTFSGSTAVLEETADGTVPESPSTVLPLDPSPGSQVHIPTSSSDSSLPPLENPPSAFTRAAVENQEVGEPAETMEESMPTTTSAVLPPTPAPQGERSMPTTTSAVLPPTPAPQGEESMPTTTSAVLPPTPAPQGDRSMPPLLPQESIYNSGDAGATVDSDRSSHEWQIDVEEGASSASVNPEDGSFDAENPEDDIYQ